MYKETRGKSRRDPEPRFGSTLTSPRLNRSGLQRVISYTAWMDGRLQARRQGINLRMKQHRTRTRYIYPLATSWYNTDFSPNGAVPQVLSLLVNLDRSVLVLLVTLYDRLEPHGALPWQGREILGAGVRVRMSIRMTDPVVFSRIAFTIVNVKRGSRREPEEVGSRIPFVSRIAASKGQPRASFVLRIVNRQDVRQETIPLLQKRPRNVVRLAERLIQQPPHRLCVFLAAVYVRERGQGRRGEDQHYPPVPHLGRIWRLPTYYLPVLT